MQKISRNPAVAYQQGVKEGFEQRRCEDTRCGFDFMLSLLLTAMYNANIRKDGSTILYKPKFREFYCRTYAELIKQRDGATAPDGSISIDDKVDLLEAHDAQVRRRMELDKESVVVALKEYIEESERGLQGKEKDS